MPRRATKKILNSKFISRSKIIFIGTIIAQIITFATSFVITGFFSPADLGLLGTLTALISIIAGTSSFRFELAIINSDQSSAPTVFLQATLFSGFISTIFCISCLFLPWGFAKIISNHFFPFLIWTWSYLLFFNSRQLPYVFNQLNLASKGAIFRSLFTFIYQLVGGVLNPTFGWLLSGRIAGDYIGSVTHLAKYFKLMDVRRALLGMGSFLKRHKDYFYLMTPHYLCVALSSHIIVLFLDRGYGLVTVGFFTLAQRLIQDPMEIISSSLFNVTNQRFSELKNSHLEMKSFFIKIVFFSLGLSLAFGFVIFFSVDYFIPLLGSKWSEASLMAKYLVPLFMATLISTPTSNFLRFIDRSDIQLGLEVLELSLKITLLVFFKFDSAEKLVLSYSLLSFFLVLIKSGIVYQVFSSRGKNGT